jgi:hypothetical protein
MPEPANSFPRKIPGVVFVSFAMFAADFERPARADNACIEQPGRPVAGANWVLRHDSAKGRECWMLVDAFGHETSVWGGSVVMRPAQPSAAPAPALSPQNESWLDKFNVRGPSAHPTPERNAPQITNPGPRPRHRPEGDIANANNGIRANQKGNGKGNAAKQASPAQIGPQEIAQFEEFLRWREIHAPVILEPHEMAQFEEFLRWREGQRLTAGMKPAPPPRK